MTDQPSGEVILYLRDDGFPALAVLLEAGFATDATRINAEQIFREIPPETEVRTI